MRQPGRVASNVVSSSMGTEDKTATEKMISNVDKADLQDLRFPLNAFL